jgi:hypothetical protein
MLLQRSCTAQCAKRDDELRKAAQQSQLAAQRAPDANDDDNDNVALDVVRDTKHAKVSDVKSATSASATTSSSRDRRPPADDGTRNERQRSASPPPRYGSHRWLRERDEQRRDRDDDHVHDRRPRVNGVADRDEARNVDTKAPTAATAVAVAPASQTSAATASTAAAAATDADEVESGEMVDDVPSVPSAPSALSVTDADAKPAPGDATATTNADADSAVRVDELKREPHDDAEKQTLTKQTDDALHDDKARASAVDGSAQRSSDERHGTRVSRADDKSTFRRRVDTGDKLDARARDDDSRFSQRDSKRGRRDRDTSADDDDDDDARRPWRRRRDDNNAAGDRDWSRRRDDDSDSSRRPRARDGDRRWRRDDEFGR